MLVTPMVCPTVAFGLASGNGSAGCATSGAAARSANVTANARIFMNPSWIVYSNSESSAWRGLEPVDRIDFAICQPHRVRSVGRLAGLWRESAGAGVAQRAAVASRPPASSDRGAQELRLLRRHRAPGPRHRGD